MPNGSVLILTDETQFATALSGSWQGQQKIPDITVLNSNFWRNYDAAAHDLIVVGPISGGKLYSLLDSLEHDHAVILCLPLDSYNDLRARYPRLLHICLREDWAQTVLLVADETLRRLEAMKAAKRAEREAARNQNLATLGRYMIGHEAQYEQCADLDAGQCRTFATRTRPAFFAIARTNQDHAQHGDAH